MMIKEKFLAWQCRLRQEAMRNDGGKPSPGMRPRVTAENDTEIATAITVLIVENDPGMTADTLRHAILRTRDPQKSYEEGLRLLSAEYYQDPAAFSGMMTAQFAAESPTAAGILARGTCVLSFEQGARRFRIPCHVVELQEDELAYRMTYWHNRIFNPSTPAAVRMLGFYPDWDRSTAG